ncbi:MAG: hypothetical protein IT204_08640 [Fimbriimonadaceae bacterium]|nr:hypothetical protein [Fimbriimonadaceae bacterium]
MTPRELLNQPPACPWSKARCYVPSILFMVTVALLIAWGTWELRGRQWAALRPRHFVNGALLWFVMTPVLLGIGRGARRNLRRV